MKRVGFALAVGAVVLMAHGASAQQVGGRLDHMVCYKVKDPLKLPKLTFADLYTELQPEFTQRGCILGKPIEFCVPATKLNVSPPPVNPNITGQPLKTDYICYQAKCKTPVPPPDRLVFDQFGRRLQQKYQVRKVCVPAVKRPPGCGLVGSACEGACPLATQECRKFKTTSGAVTCDCVDRPTVCGGRPDAAGICTGRCIDPAEKCVLSLVGDPANPTAKPKAICNCQPPPPPLCGIDPATGQCGGNCPNPLDKCVMDATGRCRCGPAEDPCHYAGTTTGAPACGGTCPNPGQQCVFVPGTQSCTCDPPTGCQRDPVTGQCGGDCPAPLVCVINSAGQCDCQDPPCSGTVGADGTLMCGGTCPDPADTCLPDATGACRCQRPDTNPCDPASCNPVPCPPGATCSLVPGTTFCRCQCDPNQCPTAPCPTGSTCTLTANGCLCQ